MQFLSRRGLSGQIFPTKCQLELIVKHAVLNRECLSGVKSLELFGAMCKVFEPCKEERKTISTAQSKWRERTSRK